MFETQYLLRSRVLSNFIYKHQVMFKRKQKKRLIKIEMAAVLAIKRTAFWKDLGLEELEYGKIRDKSLRVEKKASWVDFSTFKAEIISHCSQGDFFLANEFVFACGISGGMLNE